MKTQEVKKKNPLWKNFVAIFFTIFLLFSNIYLIYGITLYNSIETTLRILGSIALIDLTFILWLLILKFKYYRKQKAFIIISIITLVYCCTLTFVGTKVNGIYNKIATISNQKYEKYSTSIITTKNNTEDKVSNIGSNKVGIINDQSDYEGYTIGNKIIKEYKLSNTVRYNDYTELITDLVKGKIKYAIVPTSYESRIASSDKAEQLVAKTKIIYTKDEKKEKKITNKNTKKLNEPFTVLIMGVDTVSDGFQAGFNGDALILVTFNPKTTTATMLSIPRDTYMPISCMNGRKNKITNAGWRGQDCIINSIENYFGVNIDYHIKINFNGVVKLINSVKGVEVDVPYSFCEQDSKRRWGKHTVFVKAGKQTLNGEKALAFARHRKVTPYMSSYCGPEYTKNAGYWNDFTRGQNQQIIIKALMAKLKDMDSFSTVEKILDTISKNLETDISTNNLLSLYNLAKDAIKKSSNKDEAINIQKLYLSGRDARIYDYSFAHNSGSRLSLYNYVAYEESKNAVIDAMKVNLDKKAATPIKSFTFSVKTEYEEPVIGKGIGSNAKITLLPDFTGRNVREAESFASRNGINLSIIDVEGSSKQFVGQVISQDIPATTDIDMLNSSKTVTLKVVKSIKRTVTPVTPDPTPVRDTPKEENKEDNNSADSNTQSNQNNTENQESNQNNT